LRRDQAGPLLEKLAIDDWLRGAFTVRDDDLVYDSHFDELLPGDVSLPRGEALVALACAVVDAVCLKARALESLRDVRHVVVLLPLPISQEIKLWEPDFWFQSDPTNEPPTLMLMKPDFYCSRYAEEYFRQVELPITDYPSVTAVYKSWILLKKFNEYSNGIYLITDL
jgi:hypothetical protein